MSRRPGGRGRWDRGEGKKPVYRFDEDPILTLVNYEAARDGEIESCSVNSVSGGKLLTEGRGYHFDPESKVIRFSGDVIYEDGFGKTELTVSLKIGEKSFRERLSFTTDRSAALEGDDWGESEVSYSGLSRRRELKKRITFSGVPEEDIRNAAFFASSGEALRGLRLEKEGGGWFLSIPFSSVSEHIETQWGLERAVVEMRVRGVRNYKITLEYRPSPALSVDRSELYVSEDPVLELRNYEGADSAAPSVFLREGETGEGEGRRLVEGQDFSWNGSSRKLTLRSAAVLGTGRLRAARAVTVEVAAGEDRASVGLFYRKSVDLKAVQAGEAVVYGSAFAELSGYEAGMELKETVRIFRGETQIEIDAAEKRADEEGKLRVRLPFEQLSPYLENNGLLLTVRSEGEEAPLSIRYQEPARDGAEIPLRASLKKKNGDAIEAQDGAPKYTLHSPVYLEPEEGAGLSPEQWRRLGVRVKRKNADDASAFSLEVMDVNLEKKEGGWRREIPMITLGSLYKGAEKLGEIKKDEDGNFPVLTLTLYLPGCAAKELELVLFRYGD